MTTQRGTELYRQMNDLAERIEVFNAAMEMASEGGGRAELIEVMMSDPNSNISGNPDVSFTEFARQVQEYARKLEEERRIAVAIIADVARRDGRFDVGADGSIQVKPEFGKERR